MITSNSLAETAARPLRFPDVGTIPREEHDRVLSALVRPPILIGDGSLLDDVWPLRPDGPRGRRSPRKIDFRVPIAPGPILLTDPVSLNDLLTAKLYVYYSISNGHEGWTNSSEVLKGNWTSLLYVIRWRIALGLPRMENLTQPWFDLFVEQVKQGGRWLLLPHEERIRHYLAEIRDGRDVLPIVGRWRRVLAVDEVARRLGVSGRLQIPISAWSLVLDYLASVDPVAYRNTMRLRTAEMSEEPDQSGGNGLTVLMVKGILQPFERLWILRKRLAHDPIAFRAFDHQTTCHSLAEAIASQELERTKLPPSTQVCWLFDASLRLVLTCEPHLRQMQAVVVEAFRLYPRDEKAGYTARRAASKGRDAYFRRHLPPLLRALTKSMEGSLTQDAPLLPIYTWRQMRIGLPKEGIDARDLIFVLLPAACAVVIATLTARRKNEIVGLRDDCLIYDDYGDPFLTVWIQKTLRSLDRIPVPMSVVRAVEVLLRLSADSRAEQNEPWLFSFKDPGPGTGNVDFKMGQALKALAAFVRVPPLPDGSEWDFKPHQFRVFFGTTYFWRFDYPSLTALSDFYEHFNPKMTHVYVTRQVQGTFLRLVDEKEAARRNRKTRASADGDEATRAIFLAHERARDFTACRDSFVLEIARGTITGEEPLSGWGGEAWNRELEALIEKAAADIHLVPASGSVTTLDAMLREWAKGKHIDPHPAGHGFCKCGSDRSDLAAAACLAVKRECAGEHFDTAVVTGPDYAYAADETCLGCPHNIQRRNANERYWLERLAEAEHASQKAATKPQRQIAERRAERIREHVRRCFGTRRSRT